MISMTLGRVAVVSLMAILVLGTSDTGMRLVDNQAAAAKVAYGEWNPSWQSGTGTDNSVIATRDAAMGHRLDIIHWFASAGESYSGYNHIMVDNALSLGRTPLVSWALPLGFSDTSVLDDWADGMAAKAPSLIYVRLFWEFNDPPGHPWSVCQSGQTPDQLVSTWQFIVNRFRADGATNVRWVWNPDGTMGSQMYGDTCGSLASAYPGDDYVDFRGFDTYGYNNQERYDRENAQTDSQKPMLLSEVADLDAWNGSAWVGDLSQRLQPLGYMPEVAAISWFDEDPYTLAGNASTEAAVKAMLQTPAFQAPSTQLVCPVSPYPVAGQTIGCAYQ